ncbi:MAG: DUF6414 family protein [Lactococcus raffinolactis]|jgi:hypothetical protein|uniref:DUF6414 family protein n=1 Tax=Pseudolactococcus raffinolactis TaxID=1366 RepID=UPI003991D40B
MKNINKIIYFDKETISNILQESNKGEKSTQTGISSSMKGSGEVTSETSIKLGVPFIQRLGFLFSGKVSAIYILQRDKTTTITSTEISEFKSLKSKLTSIKRVSLDDIENSSTFFRVAGGYLNMVQGGVDGVNVKEFNAVMNDFDGYDTYKIDEKRYIRFNNSAFVSNYKRNDVLTTVMDVYCIPVGKFDTGQFDFIKQIAKMQTLISGVETTSTLAEKYPPKKRTPVDDTVINEASPEIVPNEKTIELYDVVYASISTDNFTGGSNE